VSTSKDSTFNGPILAALLAERMGIFVVAIFNLAVARFIGEEFGP